MAVPRRCDLPIGLFGPAWRKSNHQHRARKIISKGDGDSVLEKFSAYWLQKLKAAIGKLTKTTFKQRRKTDGKKEKYFDHSLWNPGG
jgi:hypothetical protein